MVKNRGILLILFVALFVSIGFVSAADYNCPTSQIILRLYASSNSHAETYAGAGNYPVMICYDDLFSTSYPSTNPDPHTKTTTNNVINLSSSTNAHAGLGYSVEINYGDLVCRLVTASTVKNANEVEVISLSSNQNAHVGIAGMYNGAGNYKVLCSSSYTPTPPTSTTEQFKCATRGNPIEAVINKTTFSNGVANASQILTFSQYQDCMVSDSSGTQIDCCTSGLGPSYSCDSNGAASKCVNEVILQGQGCYQYKDSNSCNNYNDQDLQYHYDLAADFDPDLEQKCENGDLDCKCSWDLQGNTDEDGNVGPGCVFTMESTDTVNPNCKTSCSLGSSDSICTGGYAQLKVSPIFKQLSPNGCTANEVTSKTAACTTYGKTENVLCGRPVVELPFFGYKEAFFAISLLIAIYLLFLRKKN